MGGWECVAAWGCAGVCRDNLSRPVLISLLLPSSKSEASISQTQFDPLKQTHLLKPLPAHGEDQPGRIHAPRPPVAVPPGARVDLEKPDGF